MIGQVGLTGNLMFDQRIKHSEARQSQISREDSFRLRISQCKNLKIGK